MQTPLDIAREYDRRKDRTEIVRSLRKHGHADAAFHVECQYGLVGADPEAVTFGVPGPDVDGTATRAEGAGRGNDE